MSKLVQKLYLKLSSVVLIGSAVSLLAACSSPSPSDHIRELVEKNTLHNGMNRTEVISLIGEPTKDYGDKELYFLGDEQGLGVDTESLIINYDQQERVVSLRISRT